jgi:mRNA interferase RelE/StbE
LAWKIEFDAHAKKELARLDRQVQDRITRYLSEHIAPLEDARLVGKALTGPWKDYWSYRIGDYRVIADLEDEVMVIFVVRIGHRREVYDR